MRINDQIEIAEWELTESFTRASGPGAPDHETSGSDAAPLVAYHLMASRDPDVAAWESLSDDERRMYARQMEVYAGFIELGIDCGAVPSQSMGHHSSRVKAAGPSDLRGSSPCPDLAEAGCSGGRSSPIDPSQVTRCQAGTGGRDQTSVFADELARPSMAADLQAEEIDSCPRRGARVATALVFLQGSCRNLKYVTVWESMLFYKNDLKRAPNRLMTPEDLMKLKPMPVYIQYQ